MPFSARNVLPAALLVTLVISPLGAQELTEKELIQRFLVDSPQVRALRAGIESVSAEARGRALYPNPSATYSREGAGLAEFFEYGQPLVLTARRRFLTQAAVAAEAAARHEVDRNLWELRADLRVTFYRFLETVQEPHQQGSPDS
jgi:hypothetical protein